MPHDTVPRLASTTLVVRDGPEGVEVLMLRRSLQASFMPGAYVFPGGAVDADDTRPALLAACDETPDALAARWGAGDTAIAHAVAALRECFEECGLWLGAGPAPATDTLASARALLAAPPADDDAPPLLAASRHLGRPIATSALQPWSHWVTPIDLPRRFDTRFFVALAPPGQQPTADEGETTALVWVSPAQALARHERGELPLEFATASTLRSLRPHAGSTAALLAEAQGRRELTAQHPRVARDPAGRTAVLLPGEPAHAEVQRLDPLGSASAACFLPPGVPVRLGPALRRLTAPNPGMMTGPGTNTYLLGRDGRHAVLDPGPAIEAHVEAILAACDGRIETVLVTHTHHDHSPAAAMLAARCGARLVGLPPPPGTRQDPSFRPDHRPADGEWIDAAGCRLQAVHTPGHASNHVCWWYEDEALLFTGDHLMQGSTVVIDPPDGDMAAYLASLEGLPSRLPALAWLAPGHGFLIDRPVQAIARLVAHRLAREARVLAAVPQGEGATVAALVPGVYADVPPKLHALAGRSLLAHLLKLQAEGRVRLEGEGAAARWRR